MARIPISILKFKSNTGHQRVNYELTNNEATKFLIQILEKGENWNKTIICEREELIKLRNEIDTLINETTTAEILRLPLDRAETVDKHYATDSLCIECPYKLTHKCIECIFVLQSPLERQLFIELSKAYINFQTQYALNWKGENISTAGKSYSNELNNFKNVLTIVDFYIEKKDLRLCIYTDGHTYHERTEEQAQRDRNIDRKLQELGFSVLRYTGKDVNENIEKIISEIKKWIKY